jgi:nicotinate-nucleotide adenylyltransferase
MDSIDFIYFGGTFDPVHDGHVDAVRIVRETFPDAKITIIPGFQTPVAAGGVKSPSAPFVDRVAMAVVAFDEWPMVDVSSMEEELPTPNYTYRTLETLVADLPASRVAWMIGADQLAKFMGWEKPRRILELASLVVVPRPDVGGAPSLELARNIATALGFSVNVDAKNMRVDLDGGGSIYVMKRAPKSISSSEVRKLAAVGLKKIDGLVPASVVEYIADLGLYQQHPDVVPQLD